MGIPGHRAPPRGPSASGVARPSAAGSGGARGSSGANRAPGVWGCTAHRAVAGWSRQFGGCFPSPFL